MSEWKTTPSSDLALNELHDEIGRLQSEVLRLTNELAVERARSSAAREEEARQKRLDETARLLCVHGLPYAPTDAFARYAIAEGIVRDAYRLAEIVEQAREQCVAQRAQSATSSASSKPRKS